MLLCIPCVHAVTVRTPWDDTVVNEDVPRGQQIEWKYSVFDIISFINSYLWLAIWLICFIVIIRNWIKLIIEFFSHTSPISNAQQPHMADGYIGQHRHGTLLSSQRVLNGTGTSSLLVSHCSSCAISVRHSPGCFLNICASGPSNTFDKSVVNALPLNYDMSGLRTNFRSLFK